MSYGGFMRNYYGEYEHYYKNISNKNRKYMMNSHRNYGRGSNKNTKNKGSFFSIEHQIKIIIRQLVVVFILLLAYIGIKFVNTPGTKVVHTYVTNALEYNQDFSEYIDKAVTLKWSDIEIYATETYKYINDKLETLKSQ